MKLRLISEIIKCFIEGLNASKCYDKLKNVINVEVSSGGFPLSPNPTFVLSTFQK